MALNKKDKWKPCIVHCVLYTISVVLFTFPEIFSLDFMTIIFCTVAIFLSHVVLDKTSLVQHWLHAIRGRSFQRAVDYSDDANNPEIYKQFNVAFTAVAYTMLDNTVHDVDVHRVFFINSFVFIPTYICTMVMVLILDQFYSLLKKKVERGMD